MITITTTKNQAQIEHLEFCVLIAATSQHDQVTKKKKDKKILLYEYGYLDMVDECYVRMMVMLVGYELN